MSEAKDVREKLTVYHSASCNGRKLATIHGIDEAASALSPGEYQLVLAALEQAPKPAGGEWVTVPREPTREMVWAFWNASGPDAERYRAMISAAPPTPAASPSGGEVEDWRDDPSSDERWNAGLDFGMNQLCIAIGVDPKDVNWDAATETLDGDVQSVIWNILCARFGEEFPPVTPPEAPQASEVVRELVRLLRESRDDLDNWVCILAVSVDDDGSKDDTNKLIARIDAALAKIGGDHDK